MCCVCVPYIFHLSFFFFLAFPLPDFNSRQLCVSLLLLLLLLQTKENSIILLHFFMPQNGDGNKAMKVREEGGEINRKGDLKLVAQLLLHLHIVLCLLASLAPHHRSLP